MSLLAVALVVAVGTAAAEPARVAAARAEKQALVEAMFREKGVAYPPPAVFLRAFKSERVVELWAGDARAPLVLVKTYPVCAQSGALGPKSRQGDLQVPEGFYTIDKLNPWSAYHLSLHVDYPNQADRARGTRAKVADLGGDIMVHGDCVTIGCIPLEDEPIEEVYLVVNDARAKGATVPIHIFPTRLDDDGLARAIASTQDEELHRFWREELLPGYRAFETEKRPPRVGVDKNGRYVLK